MRGPMEAKDALGWYSLPSAVNDQKRSVDKRIKCARSAHVGSSVYIYIYVCICIFMRMCTLYVYVYAYVYVQIWGSE